MKKPKNIKKRKTKLKKVGKQNIGNAGEYYLASILSAENFIATITLGRAEKYDILTVSPKNKTIKISVKTRYKKDIRFPLNKKDEKGGQDDFYYAFVMLNEFKTEPDFWIIPSKVVNSILAKAHKTWLKDRSHHDNPMRNLHIVEHKQTKKLLYPKNWGKQLSLYYKNIDQLK